MPIKNWVPQEGRLNSTVQASSYNSSSQTAAHENSVYKSAFKHGPNPSASGFLKSTLSSSRSYCIKRGIVECPLNIQESTQHNLFVINRFFQSVNNL